MGPEHLHELPKNTLTLFQSHALQFHIQGKCKYPLKGITEEQFLSQAMCMWSVSDFIFLALAYEGESSSSPSNPPTKSLLVIAQLAQGSHQEITNKHYNIHRHKHNIFSFYISSYIHLYI